MSLSFANEERYLLQPTKTVALNIKPSKRTTIPKSECFKLGEINLNHVDTSQRQDVLCTVSLEPGCTVTMVWTTNQCWIFISHFVFPVLTYGIEIFTPKSTLIKQLDLFQRKTIKQILSLPNNTADPCVLILTGLLPIEAIFV
ncbi:hypothetical protein DPMN_052962 [Dreissena polymorpha]|uniref:Uncharacterized protein n=1 Tax=Dreissena polymorpha TaxID=45954 RepID=A0A9D4CL91_DREPO|nr:hypothetical protein DPMN_052962 [Dreissena polymorpha]